MTTGRREIYIYDPKSESWMLMRLDAADERSGLTSGEYALRVWTAPFRCALTDCATGIPVWQMVAVMIRHEEGPWLRVNRAELKTAKADRLALQLAAEDGSAIVLELALTGERLEVDLRADVEGRSWLGADLHAGSDEHYLGFGERFDSLDQRGKQMDLWVEDGAQGGLSYIPVPFFLSSAGYGLHIDTEVRCVVRVATPDDPGVISIRNAATALRLTLLPGRTPKEVLSRYTAIAGRPEVPPAWVFGPWKSRDWQTADQAGIREDVEKQHELGLPATVKLIDARWEAAYHTFSFDPRKFPDPQAMIQHIHAHGSRLVVWISPWLAVNNGEDPDDAFYACAERGYLIKNQQGEAYVHRLGNNPMLVGSCIDLTNPEAAAWWQDNIRRLVEMGVSGFNTDFGEQVPEDALFYDGRTGREMHNVYPRLYNELTYEAMQAGQPGVLLARAGWHGSQRLSAIWAGDQTSDFAHNSGLRTAIIAALSAGLSGFPYWGSDIGGYFGTPDDQVYMRWTQFGAFCPIMMVHGAGRREPWTFSEQTLEVYRRYARLHTDLFPYIYACAHEASRTGIPIMRAMPLEFPDDPCVWGDLAEHQYCFGADLLVAPVYYGFSRIRPVYLPEGQWRDFWTGELLAGGRVVRRRVDVEQIPVFVRAGGIIPRLDACFRHRPPYRCGQPPTTPPSGLHLGADAGPAGDDLRLDLYPGTDGRFRLADGTELAWDEAAQTLTVSSSPVERRVSVRRVGVEPDYRRVTVAGPVTVVEWRS